MLGLMQDWPLLIHKVIDFAAIQHPRPGSRDAPGRGSDPPYQLRARCALARCSVAQRLARDGIEFGDRVATLAWNDYRHLEAWYGITGVGAIYHTVNPRLFPEQIVWIMNHAEDRIAVRRSDLRAAARSDRRQAADRRALRRLSPTRAHMPATKLKNAVAYEDWIGEADGDFRWAEFDERTAAGLCYTSGTTGHPKGVLYSHRSNVLHSLFGDRTRLPADRTRDTVLPVVPMFHANSWGLAFSGPMRGARWSCRARSSTAPRSTNCWKPKR